MQPKKRRRGRPRKQKGTVSFRHVRLAGIVISFFDKLRPKVKHYVAVEETVKFVKRRYPKFRISASGVKRILTEFRPRGSQRTLRFRRTPITKQDRTKFRTVRDQVIAFNEREGLDLPVPPVFNPPKRATKILFGFAKRPEYRHNRKKHNRKKNKASLN